MPRAILACLLILLLSVGASPVWAADLSVQQQVAKVGNGRKIVVKMISGETVKGRMVSVAADQFTFTPAMSPNGTTKVVLFTEVQSVKRDGLTTGQKWMIVGGVWVGLAIVGSRL